MEQKQYTVALDLGTSKMLAMAATRLSDGTLSVLGYEKIPSGNCIRRGCVYNIEETGTNVRNLISRLGFKVQSGIQKVYVGIGGQSLRTEYYAVKQEVNGLITKEILDSLYERCEQYKAELTEILEIVAPEYYVDGKVETNPQGVYCKEIEAKFQLVLGRPTLSLNQSMAKARVEVAGFFIAPLATAEVTLTEREKDLGCALIELGAGVTYLSIYKSGLLKQLLTIPLGGNVITKDLCDLKMSEAEAEEQKIREGNALLEAGKEEQLLDTIVEARINEIVANVIEQINRSGYEKELNGGIVITGGSSLLKNLDKLLEQKTGKTVRKTEKDPTQACVLGLLTLGKENCAKEIKVEIAPPPPPTTEKPKKTKPSIMERFAGTLFDN